MNHSDVQDHMADYLEGHLPLEKRALFDAHLDDCSNCFDEIREVQRTITLLQSLPEPEVPEGFAESVMGLVREQEDRTSWIESLRETFRLLTNPRVLVPASIAMIALGIIGGTRQVQDVLVVSAGNPQFAGQTQPGEGSRLAGIPTPATSFDAGPTSNRARANPTLQVRIQLDPGLKSLPGPIRVPSHQVAGQAPTFSRSFLRNDGQFGGRLVSDRLGSMSPGQTGVLRVAAPGQIGNTGRMALGNSLQRQPLERQPSADEWLARLRRSPGDFASLISSSSLAEQELWVANLTRHAIERGELESVVAALRESSSKKANRLADDFAAAARGPIADGSRIRARD